MRLLTGNLIFFGRRRAAIGYWLLEGLEGLLDLVVEAEGVGIHATMVVVALDDLRTQ